jgi:hypothetical protein
MLQHLKSTVATSRKNVATSQIDCCNTVKSNLRETSSGMKTVATSRKNCVRETSNGMKREM